MALTAYLLATNRLLQNPVPANPLYSTTDLTAYINEARQQLAGDTECIRATATANFSAPQQIYGFSIFQTFPLSTVSTGSIFFPANPTAMDTVTLNGVVWTFIAGATSGTNIHIDITTALTVAHFQVALAASVDPLLTVASYSYSGGPSTATLSIIYNSVGTGGNSYTLAASAATISGSTLTGGGTNMQGIQSVLTIRQLAINTTGSTYKALISRPWPWFNRYYLTNGSAQTLGVPTTWSQLGLGNSGSFGVGPPPLSSLFLKADVVCLPVALTSDSTPEAIPYPFTDAIPYYAAYKAYLSSQKTQDATTMFTRYKEFAKRAVDETAPTVLPGNYLGGRGAKMVASKTTLTDQGQPQGGQ